MRLYVIRHGETSWNTERRLQGHMGADLNENGVRLAEVTARALKEVPFEMCYTSPLTRALHTAEIILAGRDVPVIKEDRIMEVGFGVWEGLHCMPEHMEIPEEQFRAFHASPFSYVAPQGGETILEVCARTEDFFQELIHRPELQEKTILISTHGCATRALLHNVYEEKDDFWHGGVPLNCAVNIIDVTEGKAVLTEADRIYYDPSESQNYFDMEKQA